jgi:hypothetical protein
MSIMTYSTNDRLWHDPAHVLVGTFAGRRPKPFGAFLTPKGHHMGTPWGFSA